MVFVRPTQDQAMAADPSVDPEGWQSIFESVMSRIAGRFTRVEPRRTARAFLTGLLAGLPKMNCWTLSEHAGDATPDKMQRLLSRAEWDANEIRDDAEGYRHLLELLAEAGDNAEDPIPVAVETARGLLISRLRTTGRKVYSINPMAVARYGERHRVTRAKSDHADAMALANILRTDAEAHRPLPADSGHPTPSAA